jgi:aminopeptidase N
MKIYLFSFVFVFFGILLHAQNNKIESCQQIHQKKNVKPLEIQTASANLRSDTMDVLHTDIHLNITDFTTNIISGFTTLTLNPKLNSQSHVMIDLLKMTIDSITCSNILCNYQYNDTLMKVILPLTFNTTDTFKVNIFYHGTPQMDPSGWGGFYFSSGYAFNLGVGFDTKPHNFGRAWFPCFDNFAERCRFDFHITSANGKIAYCNGYLASDTTIATLRTRHWVLNEEIPTYLASVSVAPYTQVNQTFSGMNGNKPIILAALPADTTKIKNSFVNLNGALTAFEGAYGPYEWNRVGYCLVPFASGAMEHATNIAYPQAAANGALTYEDVLMAHELAHHWWGDLVTCETAEDMWINEGWATYSGFLFNDKVYNYKTYLQKVKASHQPTMQHAHHKEGGFLALNSIPHQFTYGDHVYNKGADVAHTLRGYLGDSLFFSGLNDVMQQKKFKTMNSIEFRDLLSFSTGVNMNDFFDAWVFNGGWPHFSIDSFFVSGSSSPYTVSVYSKQKLYGAPNYFNNVPMEFMFMNANRNQELHKAILSGPNSISTFTVSVLPVYVGINFNSKISDAINSEYKTMKANSGTQNFSLANFNFLAQASGTDSSFIRVEHSIVAPDPIKNNSNNYKISKEHYWKIDGITAPGFNGKGYFYFDGRKIASGNAYLDTSLTSYSSDSIILLYRRDAKDDWKEYPYYTKFYTGGSFSKYGNCRADSLKLGEYTFANGVSSVISTKNNPLFVNEIKIYPNPSKDWVTLEFVSNGVTNVKMTDINGKEVWGKKNPGKKENVNCAAFARGIYFIQFENKEGKLLTDKLIIE